jgi:hypothetical protein
MKELICNIRVPRNPQELEQAVQQYKNSDLTGDELLCYWQAIRDASLSQGVANADGDKVPGQDSY